MNTQLPVPADEVWKIVGGFNALPDWHPGVQKSELEDGGRQRTLRLAGGAIMVETLVKHDDGSRTYTYEMKDSPLPVANYVATIRVSPSGEQGCTIEWSSSFEAAGAPEHEVVKLVQDIYQAGFDNLKKMFGG